MATTLKTMETTVNTKLISEDNVFINKTKMERSNMEQTSKSSISQEAG